MPKVGDQINWYLSFCHRTLSYVITHLLRGDLKSIFNKIKFIGLPQKNNYPEWAQLYGYNPEEAPCVLENIKRLPHHPLISILMPTYNTNPRHLREAIASIRNQLYENWELIISDDASTHAGTLETLKHFEGIDSRIRILYGKTNGHICKATNAALAKANGEFTAFIGHDDLLAPHALYMIVKEINDHPQSNIIYSDEGRVDPEGRPLEGLFKPDWNRTLFYTHNYINHLMVFRTSLMKSLGGFREGFEGAHSYDLILRSLQSIDENTIRHITHVLYHWRHVADCLSTTHKQCCEDAHIKALKEHLPHCGISPSSYLSEHTQVSWPLPTPLPKVSILIPTRDQVGLLKSCVESLLARTDYDNLEILILDNDSKEPQTFAYFDTLQNIGTIKVVACPGEFNYSAINNRGVAHTSGELILLLNNDIQVTHSSWLKEMVSQILRQDQRIGIVGAKLLYPTHKIQHAGIVMGLGDLVGHSHYMRNPNTPLTLIEQDISAVTGACLLTTKSIWHEVGGLDETNLKVSYNDVDFCLKVRERRYKIVFTPHAELLHIESASRFYDTNRDKIEKSQRERDFFKKRWQHLLDAGDPYYNPNLCLSTQSHSLAFPPRICKPWLK